MPLELRHVDAEITGQFRDTTRRRALTAFHARSVLHSASRAHTPMYLERTVLELDEATLQVSSSYAGPLRQLAYLDVLHAEPEPRYAAELLSSRCE